MTAAEPFVWESWRPKQLRFGNAEPEDPPDYKYLRCRPSLAVVLDVIEYPPAELGMWFAHWTGRGSAGLRGKAESVGEAKEQALDAAETMLAHDLDALEARRLALMVKP